MLGKEHEQLARIYLEQQGLIFIAANQYSRYGEIDLIMLDQTELVFVEVKHRSYDSYGAVSELLTKQKQEKMLKTALLWLENYNKPITNYRFDYICISGEQNKIDWYKYVISHQLW